MEAWGLVDRKDYEVVPPSVEYSLSTTGVKFNEALDMLCNWASTNEDVVFSMTEARQKTQSGQQLRG